MHLEREEILKAYGWNEGFAEAARSPEFDGLEPARVLETRRGAWTVLAAGDSGPRELEAAAAGRLLHEAAAQADLPATGTGSWSARRIPAVRSSRPSCPAGRSSPGNAPERPSGTGSTSR